jgi:HAD superfamily hydrolase (TIGR01509 family)
MLIEGYILDIDGTLLDSSPIHLRSWQEALTKFDIHRTDQEIVAEFGKPTWKIAEILLKNGDPHQAIAIAKEKTNRFIALIPKIPLFPRVQDVLQRIYEQGGKIFFASSNFNRVIEIMTKIYHWDRIGIGYLGTDDIQHAKPHPEMILKAMHYLHLPPEKCVMIGDSIFDIEAGKSAGIYTVAVCTGSTPRDKLTILQPNLILPSFGDLWDLLPLSF